MKKMLIITAITLFSVCFLMTAREGVSGGVCMPEDMAGCIDHTVTCIFALDDRSPAYEMELATCHRALCACLHSQGCDERLDEANCD